MICFVHHLTFRLKTFSEAFKNLMNHESKPVGLNGKRFLYICKAHEKKYYRIAKFLFIYPIEEESDSVKVELMLKSMNDYFDLYIEDIDDNGKVKRKRKPTGKWKEALLFVAELSIIDKFADCLVEFLNIMTEITDDEMNILKQFRESKHQVRNIEL